MQLRNTKIHYLSLNKNLFWRNLELFSFSFCTLYLICSPILRKLDIRLCAGSRAKYRLRMCLSEMHLQNWKLREISFVLVYNLPMLERNGPSMSVLMVGGHIVLCVFGKSRGRRWKRFLSGIAFVYLRNKQVS